MDHEAATDGGVPLCGVSSGGGPGGDGPPEAASCSSQGPTTASRAGWDLGVQAPDPVGGLVDLAGQVQIEASQHAQRYGLLRGANGSQGVGMVLAASAMASSLSSCLCMWCGLQVGVDSVGIGQGQLLEGLLPVGGYSALDQSAGGRALTGPSFLLLLLPLSGSLVLDVADSQLSAA